LSQLADILVLWSCTSNFSRPELFSEYVSQPITVTARELGTNIPRNKIFRTLSQDDRKRSSRIASNENINSNNGLSPTLEKNCWTPKSVENSALELDEPSTMNQRTEDTISIALSVGLSDSFATEPSGLVATVTDTANSENTRAGSAMEASEQVKLDIDEVVVSKRDPYLSPNEPVFMGAKVYPPLFCFWQVCILLPVFDNN
jgi:hypothetical protein